MSFTTTLQKAYELEANATCINKEKNRQKFFFESRKITRSSMDNKET